MSCCSAWQIPIAVHPVPTPLSTVLIVSKRVSDGGNNQNLMLFICGNAMCGAPNINGTSQFLKPLIMIGKTMKKIMMKAWAVTMTKIWLSPIEDPGCPISVWVSILREVPTIPDQAPNTKYNVPMSLWLVEKSPWVKISGVAENNKKAIGCKSI